MSEQTTADVIKDLQSKPQVPIKGNTSDFIKKFSKTQSDSGMPSGTNVGDPTLGLRKTESDPSDEIQNDDDSVIGEVIGSDKKDGTPIGATKKKGFVEKQIEENRRLKEELEKYKKEEIPKFTSKIEELEKLVKNSESTAEANHYQEQLNAARKEKLEIENNLTKEIADLRGKLSFHDLASSTDFQDRYIKPIQESYVAAKEVIGDDPSLLSTFQRAIAANVAALSAASQEERAAALRERDEAFEEISGSLSSFKQVRFADQVVAYMKATNAHSAALANHEQTKEEISRQAKEKELEARSSFLKKWKSSYDEQDEFIAKEAFIPDEVYSYMKEKGIKYDISSDEAIALAATQQSNEPASVDDMNRLIAQGKHFKKMQAQVKALQEMLREKDDYIKKLKGSSSVTSSGNATDSQKARLTVSEGLKAKIAQFSPRNRVA